MLDHCRVLIHASFANWAPDGKTILFCGSADGGENSELLTMEPDGSHWRAMRGVAAGAVAPSWNPADFSG